MSEAEIGVCAYCTTITTLYWTGRRSICRQCFVDNMGEPPPEPSQVARPHFAPCVPQPIRHAEVNQAPKSQVGMSGTERFRARWPWLPYFFKSKTLRRLKLLQWIAPEAVEALEFYADPDTYFAIGFWPDPPCGEFDNDGGYFTPDGERCDEDAPHARWRPGEKARKALGWH